MPSADTPVLLVLDSATERLHLGACAGPREHVVALAGGAQASAALLPALSAALVAVGQSWEGVDAIAFGAGPGAFTGLRTACSIAQGLALGRGCALITLDTLMVVAEDARLRAAAHGIDWTDGTEVWVLQDARMAELYVAPFTWQVGRWRATQAPALWPLDEPARRWAAGAADAWLAGNAFAAYPDQLGAVQAQAGERCDAQAVPSGQALLSLARQAWSHGETVDAALALPRYVRDKVAQTTAERQARSS